MRVSVVIAICVLVAGFLICIYVTQLPPLTTGNSAQSHASCYTCADYSAGRIDVPVQDPMQLGNHIFFTTLYLLYYWFRCYFLVWPMKIACILHRVCYEALMRLGQTLYLLGLLIYPEITVIEPLLFPYKPISCDMFMGW